MYPQDGVSQDDVSQNGVSLVAQAILCEGSCIVVIVTTQYNVKDLVLGKISEKKDFKSKLLSSCPSIKDVSSFEWPTIWKVRFHQGAIKEF